MSDRFEHHASGLESPATIHQALSVDAGNDVSPRPRTIYCEAAGTITIADENGTALAYTMVQGQWIPFRGVRVTAISAGTFYGWS